MDPLVQITRGQTFDRQKIINLVLLLLMDFVWLRNCAKYAPKGANMHIFFHWRILAVKLKST